MYRRRIQTAGAWVLVLASCLALSAQAASADDKRVLGYWKHIDEDSGKTQSIFKLFMYQGKLVGKIVKTYPTPGKKPNTHCTECSGSQHNKPVEGLVFFWGFVPDEDDKLKWVEGKILNPEDGKTYNGEAELSADGNTLKVFGYIRLLFKVGGSSVWQRPTPAELAGI